jgi:hypothetical protein
MQRKPVQVFTLNYDLGLEKALLESRIPFTTGFDDQGNWGPSLFNHDYEVHIAKLHGSLNWYIEEKRQGVSRFFLKANPVDQYNGSTSLELDVMTDRVVSKLNRMRFDTPKRNLRLIPPLIFGYGDKVVTGDPYLTLYSQFKEAVKNADVVIVIGYGWGDEHINTMINQNISDNCKLINITLSDGAAMLPFNCGLKEGLIAVTQSGAKSVLSGGQFKAKKAQAALLFN